MGFKRFVVLTLSFAGILISPVAAAVMFAAILICHAAGISRHKIGILVLPVSLLLILSGKMLGKPIALIEVARQLLKAVLKMRVISMGDVLPRYLISDPISVGITILVVTTAMLLFLKSPQEEMINHLEKKTKKRKLRPVNWIPSRSSVVFGVSGAGKTAFLSRVAKAIFDQENDAMQIWIDGKGSVEQYSLYDNLTRLSESAGKELIIINGTANSSLGNVVYNFLSGVTAPDQAADMIMCLITDPQVQSTAASEHYKVMTRAYLIRIIAHMMKYHVPLTLFNVVTLMDPETMKEKLTEDEVNLRERNDLINYMEQSWKSVEDSFIKLTSFIQGAGKSIFTKTGDNRKESISLTEAYRRGANVLLLADAMSMPSLAQSLVEVASMDLRNLIAGRLTNRIDMNRKVYVTFDEFTSYASALPIIQDMYSRARSADVIMTLATQSASDIMGIGGSAYEKIVNTADRFVVFRQHGAESPEAAAQLFSTRITVTQTTRTSGHFSTHESSNTIERQYRVHPDEIRKLSANFGFLMDAGGKQEVKYFKNEFV